MAGYLKQVLGRLQSISVCVRSEMQERMYDTFVECLSLSSDLSMLVMSGLINRLLTG